MANYALIKTEKIDNVIVIEDSNMIEIVKNEYGYDAVIELKDGMSFGPGDLYVNGEFITQPTQPNPIPDEG